MLIADHLFILKEKINFFWRKFFFFFIFLKFSSLFLLKRYLYGLKFLNSWKNKAIYFHFLVNEANKSINL
jgi:hypothetical protein